MLPIHASSEKTADVPNSFKPLTTMPSLSSLTTASAGLMGFGSHKKVHHKRLFGVSDDRPIVISVVDDEKKLRQVIPEIRGMVREGLVILLDAELIPEPEAPN